MENWWLELILRGKSLTEVKIQRGIFQRDALSLLLFIIMMMPLTHIFKKCIGAYKLHKSQERINHLMYMDDIKLFAKTTRNVSTQKKSHQRNKYLGCPSRKILGTILKVDERRTLTNGRENNNSWRCNRPDVDRVYESRKGGRGLASIQANVDTPRLITATRNNIDNRTKITRIQKWKKNNCIDISSDKQAKTHARRLGRS